MPGRVCKENCRGLCSKWTMRPRRSAGPVPRNIFSPAMLAHLEPTRCGLRLPRRRGSRLGRHRPSKRGRKRPRSRGSRHGRHRPRSQGSANAGLHQGNGPRGPVKGTGSAAFATTTITIHAMFAGGAKSHGAMGTRCLSSLGAGLATNDGLSRPGSRGQSQRNEPVSHGLSRKRGQSQRHWPNRGRPSLGRLMPPLMRLDLPRPRALPPQVPRPHQRRREHRRH